MSLQSSAVYRVPEETETVARAAFPRGNVYIRVVDELGALYTDSRFADLFPKDGQPAISPAQLALVTIFQFAEGLSDRQAAEAVRARIDWKYALGLELSNPGFDASVLSEFRARLIEHGAETRLFETMLALLRERKLVKPRSRQRTDSTHVLAAIHVLNRLELVGEAMRHALNTLATVVPQWLRGWVPGEWFDCYGRRFEEYRLPDSLQERTALAERIGSDGRRLLEEVYNNAGTAGWLREVPAVETLRRVWVQQFHAGEPIRWRAASDLPPAPLLISSPYDPDARYSKKRETVWTGYKAHLTETCDEDTPNIITDVCTTQATTTDNAVTGMIQERLAERGLTPREHIVDIAYVTSDHIVNSRDQHECDLLGPIHDDYSWQGRAGEGFASANFTIDWEGQYAICPRGNTSMHWKPTRDSSGRDVVRIRFWPSDCDPCPVRPVCVASKRSRTLMMRPQPQFEALQAARRRQETEEFKDRYASRAGIEGTISQGVHVSDLRRTRYKGLEKTRLLHLLIATAMNLLRVAAWLAERPRSQTRQSAFRALAPVA
ncbi:MAG TPA: IS1182 family transposase, partial [Herpetosiphonaceae bacterium]|nr:IS1182 family transposase [Herpetosiphonaceae bacterium]